MWVVIAVAVLHHWIDQAPAAFLAAAACSFAITLVLAYDAAVDWADPVEHGSLAPRLQPERAWPMLRSVTGLIRVCAVPVCFVTGIVLGHLTWH
jgi:hypothetical protein